ncbi:hypothetical protein HYDPIDRAFT_35079 [Hydnomerulius pinastri MD-312]|uniref:Uncharacterized protein n=1 Tax=Hydnomerulius pinastri MD-312 TaxID=994086 RepID=A0A0C2PR08_9AGAM|nr:hypothetical protein HYDPIDRAFT_35079 [Hydnomerulius pinastri MD-312]
MTAHSIAGPGVNDTSTNAPPKMVYNSQVREAYYESLPWSVRPLSYRELIACWIDALLKKHQAADHPEILAEAKEDLADYASEIVAAIGEQQYRKWLDRFEKVLEERAGVSSDVYIYL